ncbi:MAG TPA: PEP-CTERM sorting domain-containing protein [Rhodocyclaceae bacterium]|nr:PEP-CTERM sorting domain-containing protein [Rhodocyclaceae bacterium]
MCKPALPFVFLAAALVSSPSEAALWNFSYTFSSGNEISGSFTGDKKGDYIENVKDITAKHPVIPFDQSAELFAGGWNLVTHRFDGSVLAKISPRLELNNFIFADIAPPSSPPYDPGYFFSIVNDPNFFEPQAVRVAWEGTFDEHDAPGVASRWILTQATVPEPATPALLIMSLFGFGLIRRCRYRT